MSSYDDIEKSVSDLKPVECYYFTDGTNNWRYTSIDQDVTLGGNIYTSVPVERTDIALSQDIEDAMLKINLPKDNTLAERILLNISDSLIVVYIYRYHTGYESDLRTYWKGRVVGAKINFPSAFIEIHCESNFSTLRKNGAKLRDMKLCNATIYDDRCLVDIDTFSVSGVVGGGAEGAGVFNTSISLVVTAAAAYSDKYFNGGIADFSGIYRRIVNHSGSTIVISKGVYGLENGDSVSLAPGCDQRKTTCINKFNNLPHFRGCPYIPDKNVFNGINISS